jgi:hypothetical protein
MSEETIVISPLMTVKQLADLCEKHDGYVHIESVWRSRVCVPATRSTSRCTFRTS